MNSIQEYKNTTAFAVYDRFKPIVKNDMVVWEYIGKDLIRYSLFAHIYRFVPKIRTSYGLAPAVSIMPDGNGTYFLFDHTKKTVLSENHTLTEAEYILFDYYTEEYNKTHDETTYYLVLRDAVFSIIDDIVEKKKLTINDAYNHLLSYTNYPDLVNRVHERSKIETLPEYLEQYLDVIYYIPGERFQSTLIRLQEAIPKIPYKDLILLTKHIRINSFQSD